MLQRTAVTRVATSNDFPFQSTTIDDSAVVIRNSSGCLREINLQPETRSSDGAMETSVRRIRGQFSDSSSARCVGPLFVVSFEFVPWMWPERGGVLFAQRWNHWLGKWRLKDQTAAALQGKNFSIQLQLLLCRVRCRWMDLRDILLPPSYVSCHICTFRPDHWRGGVKIFGKVSYLLANLKKSFDRRLFIKVNRRQNNNNLTFSKIISYLLQCV